MTEQEPILNPAESVSRELADTGGLRRADLAWRRVRGWSPLIDGGIEGAREDRTEIPLGTARSIAHVLGAALGRESHLAGFARNGEGHYEQLRDEYIPLYGDSETPPEVKEWIDWLGTYLVERENIGSGHRYMDEHLPPSLDRLLVRTELFVQGKPYTVHVPASLDAGGIDRVTEELIQLSIRDDSALQAFLTLPDIGANTPQLIEAFHENYVGTYADADALLRELLELDEREAEIYDYANERGFFVETLTINEEWLLDQVRETYDIVELDGRFHVFQK